jgi:hypothetical protein
MTKPKRDASDNCHQRWHRRWVRLNRTQVAISDATAIDPSKVRDGQLITEYNLGPGPELGSINSSFRSMHSRGHPYAPQDVNPPILSAKPCHRYGSSTPVWSERWPLQSARPSAEQTTDEDEPICRAVSWERPFGDYRRSERRAAMQPSLSIGSVVPPQRSRTPSRRNIGVFIGLRAKCLTVLQYGE